MTGRVISRWWALFVMPTCIAFFLGFVVPMIMGIYLSFTRFTTITDATWVGIENYKKAFADPDFVHAFWYTVAFTIVTTILVNIGAFFVAYMFTKVMHGAKLFRSVFFLPNSIGGIVLGYIWQLLLNGILAHWNLSLTYSAGWGFLGMATNRVHDDYLYRRSAISTRRTTRSCSSSWCFTTTNAVQSNTATHDAQHYSVLILNDY